MPAAKKPTDDNQDPPASEAEEVLIGHSEFVSSPSHGVGVAGLLVSDPELLQARLPASEWEALYATYMNSERP